MLKKYLLLSSVCLALSTIVCGVSNDETEARDAPLEQISVEASLDRHRVIASALSQ